MKKVLFFSAMILSACTTVPQKSASETASSELRTPAGTCGALALPNEFLIDEKLIAIGNKFTIKSSNTIPGTIEEKIFSIGKTFTLYNDKHEPVAVAHERVLSWGVNIDVTDCNGQKLGSVHEEIIKSMFHAFTTYSILDANDRVLAQSEKIDFISTDFQIFDKSNTPVARIYRGAFQFLTDKWQVTIRSQDLDPRLYVFIAAYKTAADNEKSNNDDDDN